MISESMTFFAILGINCVMLIIFGLLWDNDRKDNSKNFIKENLPCILTIIVTTLSVLSAVRYYQLGLEDGIKRGVSGNYIEVITEEIGSDGSTVSRNIKYLPKREE